MGSDELGGGMDWWVYLSTADSVIDMCVCVLCLSVGIPRTHECPAE